MNQTLADLPVDRRREAIRAALNEQYQRAYKAQAELESAKQMVAQLSLTLNALSGLTNKEPDADQ